MVSSCVISMVRKDSKSCCFSLTPRCFILPLGSFSGLIYLDLTCLWDGAESELLCVCNGFVRDSKSRRFRLTPRCFILSFIFLLGWVYIQLTCLCNGTECKLLCDHNGLQGLQVLALNLTLGPGVFYFVTYFSFCVCLLGIYLSLEW
jgi:hypothetical protein